MDRGGFCSKYWLQRPRCLELVCSSYFSLPGMERAVGRTHIEKGKASLEVAFLMSYAALLSMHGDLSLHI